MLTSIILIVLLSVGCNVPIWWMLTHDPYREIHPPLWDDTLEIPDMTFDSRGFA